MLKGALVEYGSDFLGPLPNVVIFQFNPAQVTRTLKIPQRPTGATSRETSQAGETPVERYTLTAEFSATDLLAKGNILAKAAGIAPQLAALELMARPSNVLGELLGAAIDKVSDALGGGSEDDATQPIPRESYPRILFIWGLTRVLPVIVDSMSISEIKHDSLLNPTEAQVNIGLTVIEPDPCVEDVIGSGAYLYSQGVREALAAANLVATTVDLVSDIGEVISF